MFSFSVFFYWFRRCSFNFVSVKFGSFYSFLGENLFIMGKFISGIVFFWFFSL